jgi:hypothetical protein
LGTWGLGDLGTWRLGDLGTGRLGDWETGRLGDWETGRLGDWETGRLGDLGTGRLGDWETGRLGDLGRFCTVIKNEIALPSPRHLVTSSPRLLVSRSYYPLPTTYYKILLPIPHDRIIIKMIGYLSANTINFLQFVGR